MPVRNEAWVLGLSARAALMWCDELVILDHASTDESPRITEEIARETGRVRIMRVNDPTWREMEHRQFMLTVARQYDATHMALVDADEVLTGNLLPSIRDSIERLPKGVLLQLPLYNMRGSLTRYHLNGTWGNRITSVAFQDHPKACWTGDMFHHREPAGLKWGAALPVTQGCGGVMHLWGASERRLLAKHALYKLTERLRWPDKPVQEIDQMYSLCITGHPNRPGDTPDKWTYGTAPDSWWAPYAGLPVTRLEGDLWQVAECRRLIAEHGERFTGLDLFGVV